MSTEVGSRHQGLHTTSRTFLTDVWEPPDTPTSSNAPQDNRPELSQSPSHELKRQTQKLTQINRNESNMMDEMQGVNLDSPLGIHFLILIM